MIIKRKYFLVMQLKFHIKIGNSSFLNLLILIIVIADCSNIKSQQSNKEYRIQVLRDSLLVNKLYYRDLDLTFDEINKLEIIPIDIYRVNQNAVNYENEENFSPFITDENNRIDGFIFLNNKAIGYIQAFQDGNSWDIFCGAAKIYSGNPLERLTKLITREEFGQLYIVIGADGIWLNRKGKTFVYNFYQDTPDFIPVSEYVNKILTKKALLYAINMEGYFP
jgi:hypothetical protein